MMAGLSTFYLINAPTLATVEVSSEASTSSMIYIGDGKQSWSARISDNEHAACWPPDK